MTLLNMVYKHGRFSLFMAVTFFKVAVNAELVNTKLCCLGELEFGSCEPLVTELLSTSGYIAGRVLHVFLFKDTLFNEYITNSLT